MCLEANEQSRRRNFFEAALSIKTTLAQKQKDRGRALAPAPLRQSVSPLPPPPPSTTQRSWQVVIAELSGSPILSAICTL